MVVYFPKVVLSTPRDPVVVPNVYGIGQPFDLCLINFRQNKLNSNYDMLFSMLKAPIRRAVLSKGISISRVIPFGVVTSRSFWSTTAVLKEAKASTEKKTVKSAAKPKVATKSAKPKAKKPVEKKVKKTKPTKEALPKSEFYGLIFSD